MFGGLLPNTNPAEYMKAVKKEIRRHEQERDQSTDVPSAIAQETSERVELAGKF